MKRDMLDKYHPVTAFVFFLIVIVMSVVYFHPVASAISLMAALAYAIYLEGKKALKFFFALPLMITVLTLVVNVLFVHKGITVLFYLGDNPITREAVAYGLCAGIMTASVLMWFYCAGIIMTSDKFIYIFGKVMPAASLMFSMTMRFVPRFVKQARKISTARKAMGCNDGEKARGAMKTLSVMTGWALENSIDTADSMKARGYGHHGRTRYAIFKWEARDIILLTITAALLAITVVGKIQFTCYPIILMNGSVLGITALAVICAIPVIMDITEEIKWKYFRSKI